MDYQEFKEMKIKAQKAVKIADTKINSFPTVAGGMVEESIKFSPEYKIAKGIFDIAFKALQEVNIYGCKTFRKEMRDDRLNKR